MERPEGEAWKDGPKGKAGGFWEGEGRPEPEGEEPVSHRTLPVEPRKQTNSDEHLEVLSEYDAYEQLVGTIATLNQLKGTIETSRHW